jgi:Coenzyme PQQ synthesis protein D (PqqD)
MLVNSDVLTERLGDEVAVLNLKTNRFFLLNSTGGRFWELLQSERDLAVIERQLLAEFEVDPAELTAEVKRILRLFEDEQLVLPTQE